MKRKSYSSKGSGEPGHPSETDRAQMMQQLLENVRDYAIILIGPEGKVLTWNAAAEHLKGWKAEEIIGQHFSRFYTQEDIDAGKPRIELQVAAREGRYEDEGWRVRKDGARFWANVVVTALRDQSGVLRGFGKITRDLTERRQAEEQFRGFIESAPDAVVIVSKAGEIVVVNSQTERLFGYSRDELLGKTVEMLIPQRFAAEHPALREKYFVEPRTRPMGAGLSLFALHKDGHEFPVEISLSPVETPSGLLVTASIRDITERRRVEEKIKRQAQEIMEMATVPIVQVWEGIVLAPLIGMLDSQRTQQLMERLLERITETSSPVAVLDITGVPTIDTQVAQHLIETIAAVRLLGADVILTGVRPMIAQTLVHLGIDLSNVVTRSSLAAGLQMALGALNLNVTPKAPQPHETSI